MKSTVTLANTFASRENTPKTLIFHLRCGEDMSITLQPSILHLDSRIAENKNNVPAVLLFPKCTLFLRFAPVFEFNHTNHTKQKCFVSLI